MVGRAGDIRTARGGAGHTARLGTGASGWMVALAPDEETARRLLVRDVEYHGLRILEIEYEREVFGGDEIEEIDDHLAMHFREIEPGKQTVWGTIHG